MANTEPTYICLQNMHRFEVEIARQKSSNLESGFAAHFQECWVMAKGEKSAFLWYWMALKESISADILLTEEIKIPVAKTRSNRSRYI